MKKLNKTSKSKLFLNKETVTVLNNSQLSKILGGGDTVAKQDSLAKAKQDSLAIVKQDSIAM